MKKFEVNFGGTVLAFENAWGTQFDREVKVKSIKDIMYFYNNIVVYKEYGDGEENERIEVFRSNNPDESIVEYLDSFFKGVSEVGKENAQYTDYKDDGFRRQEWTTVKSICGVGYSPSVKVIKTIFKVKQRQDDKPSNFTSYDVIFADGCMGDGKGYVFKGLNKKGILEIGRVANEFIKDFIENYDEGENS